MAVLLSTPSTSIPGIRSKAGRTDPAPPWGAGARYFSGLLLVRAPFSLAVEVAGSELPVDDVAEHGFRSEEHTSELQSLMRISYAVFCLKKKTIITIRQRQKYKITADECCR